jgi:hypothetical protein
LLQLNATQQRKYTCRFQSIFSRLPRPPRILTPARSVFSLSFSGPVIYLGNVQFLESGLRVKSEFTTRQGVSILAAVLVLALLMLWIVVLTDVPGPHFIP